MKRGAMIGGYTGKPVFCTGRKKGDKDLSLVTDCGIHFYVNGTGILSHIQHSSVRANAIIQKNGKVIVMDSIRRGEEVFVDYGVQYWRSKLLNISDDFYTIMLRTNRQVGSVINLICKSMVHTP